MTASNKWICMKCRKEFVTGDEVIKTVIYAPAQLNSAGQLVQKLVDGAELALVSNEHVACPD